MALGRVDGSPRGVLLDAFGTLVTLDAPAPLVRALLAQRLGVVVTRAQAGAAFAAEVAYYRAHMHEGTDGGRVAQLRARCAEVLRAALPPDPALQAADGAVMTAILTDALRWRVYPDAAPALVRLRAAGLRVAVASNWDVSLVDVLEHCGLGELLDGVVTSAAVGAAKPDPRPLQSALELAGVAAADAVHVGDSLQEDVGAARAAGVRPVLLVRSGQPPLGQTPPGVSVIGSLAQLPALLGL
ncbi:MAG: HAD-IA family hydrolase [Actinomycetota bacterium]|nr:HAD-IA family hydrolase [Actinomycetota bacterium]